MVSCEMVLSEDIAHPPRRVCVHDERAPLSLLLSVLPPSSLHLVRPVER